MGLSKLDQLYRQVILDHSSHPHHQGELDHKTSQIELNNPTCGDVIQLQLCIEDDVVKDAKFTGHGCSISTASASMMCDAVIGKSEKEALEMAQDFSALVQGEEIENEDRLKDAALLQGVSKFPSRIKCATLAWKALNHGIAEHEMTIVKQGPIHGKEDGHE